MRFRSSSLVTGLVLAVSLVPVRAVAQEEDYQSPPSSEAQDPIEPAPQMGQEPGGLSGELRNMEWIGFQQFEDVSRVFVRTTEPVKYSVDASRPDRIILVLHNTGISILNNANHLDTRHFDSPIYLVQPAVIEGPSPSVRIEIHLRRQAQYAEFQTDTTLALDFPRG